MIKKFTKMKKIVQLFASVLLFAGVCKAQVIINEYSCSNLTTFVDNFNETEDWIEIYNTTAAPVNLQNYCLSDKLNNLGKWKFGNVTIAANGFIRVWASNKNFTSGANLHCNFSLKQCKNDKIFLSSPALVILDSLTTKRTQTGHSRGRTTNGAATWSLFINPTPNATNNTATPYLGYASTPVINLAPGFYSGSQNVTITSPDPGTSIRYTLNGSAPTAASTLYTGAISINTTQVLRAVAISTNSSIRNSFINSNTYFINVTHSVNVISVFGDQILTLLNGTQMKPVVGVEYFEGGVLKTEAVGEANEHGNDSWAYAQRGIDLIIRDEMGYNHSLTHKIFGLKTRDEFQRLILKAGANDNYPFEGQPNSNFTGELGGAHLRDQYIHTISQLAKLNVDERTYAPAVLYANGQYWGVYDIREKVDDKDFTKFYYNSKEDSLQFLQTWGGTWSAYGGAQAQTDWTTLKNWITTNQMSVTANYNTAIAQLDEKSLADYVILNSYVVCSDWLNWNTAWWRGLNQNCTKKRWRYMLWDEDATFKHYINYTNVPNLDANADPCDPQSLGNPGSQGHVPVVNALLTNPTFKQYYVMRYFDLLNAGLSCNRMITVLDSMVAIMTPEMPKHIQRWGGSVSQWTTNVQALRNFIQARCDSVTAGFSGCYQTTGPFKIKINADPPNAGTVDFNSLNISTFLWSGTYPGNLANLLKANAKPGYCFSHWTSNFHTLTPAMTASAVSLFLTNKDSIVAHFIPTPSVNIAVPSVTICQGHTVQLNATSNGTQIAWAPVNFLSCTNCTNPIAAPVAQGTHTYQVSAGTSPGCMSAKIQTIVVTPGATAGFSIASTTTVLPNTVTVTNQSYQSVGFSWYCTNGSSSTSSTTASFIISTPGLYGVTLIAYGVNGCNDTLEKSIVINDTTGYYPPYIKLPLPNVFTPNGDGVNDGFAPVMRYVKDMNILIMDRWGKRVFEVKGPNEKWYGQNENGKDCPAGTYYYFFKATDILGKEYESNGWVQLQR
jgi:gliding motility-associated-like protein